MGWSNYLIIPNWKVAIEISRHADQDTFDYISENIDGLCREMEEFDPDILTKKCNGLDLSDLASLVKISDKATVFTELDYVYLFMAFLKSREIKFEIISEFDFEARKKELSKYRLIRR